MTTKKYRTVVKTLRKAGYERIRVNGSHEIYRNSEGKICPVKCTGTDIPAGTVANIERITGIKF